MEEIVEEEELGDVWFKQDGAAAHTAPNSMFWETFFPNVWSL
jgi:hypothetical protein